MSERDIERWTRAVAEDPGAPAFVRLARVYRRQGRGRAARDVVLAGLERNPQHVDAHALLALMYIEEGEREKAGDEWQIVLRLDQDNFHARRGLGFLALERGELDQARLHLDAALDARPGDPAVQQARDVLARREERRSADGADPDRPADDHGPSGAPTATRAQPAPASATPAPARPAETRGSGATVTATPQPGPDRDRAGATRGVADPVRLFAPLAGQPPFRGALLIDDKGLVLAGRLDDPDQSDLLGALLQAALADAARTAALLGIGAWDRYIVETDRMVLHVVSIPGGAVAVVAEPDAPAGWVARAADRATELAGSYLEAIS